MQTVVIGSFIGFTPSSAAVRYAAIGEGDWVAAGVNHSSIAPMSFTAKNFKANVGTAPGAGKSWAIDFQVNGVTKCTLSISGASQRIGKDDITTVAIQEGDLLNWKSTPTSNPAAANIGTSFIALTTSPSGPVFGSTGVDNALVAAANYYDPIQGRAVSATTATFATSVIPTSGTISNFHFAVNTAPGAGNSRTMTLNINGVDKTVTTTISDANVANTDSVHSESVSAEDLVYFNCTKSGTPAASAARWSWVWTPTIVGESLQLSASNTLAGGSTYCQHSITGQQAWHGGPAWPIVNACRCRKLYTKTWDTPGATVKVKLMEQLYPSAANDTALLVTLAGSSPYKTNSASLYVDLYEDFPLDLGMNYSAGASAIPLGTGFVTYLADPPSIGVPKSLMGVGI